MFLKCAFRNVIPKWQLRLIKSSQNDVQLLVCVLKCKVHSFRIVIVLCFPYTELYADARGANTTWTSFHLQNMSICRRWKLTIWSKLTRCPPQCYSFWTGVTLVYWPCQRMRRLNIVDVTDYPLSAQYNALLQSLLALGKWCPTLNFKINNHIPSWEWKASDRYTIG